MEILYKSNYYQISYDQTYQLIHYYHPSETFNMTPIEYLQELQATIKYSKLYQPKLGLGDLRDFQFIITPDLQEWINEHIYPIIQSISLQKHAVLLPPQFVVQLSVKQAVEISPNKSFETQYFSDESEARKWLLE